MASDGVEIRIHGIGEHGEFSSLGSNVRRSGPERAIDESPVKERTHGLILLNWSRYTRKIQRFTWFLALPYSLTNMAGYMALPVDQLPTALYRVRRVWSQITAHAFGVVLTMCSVPWIAACFEAFFRHWRGPTLVEPSVWGRWPVLAAGCLLGVPIMFRAIRQRQDVDTVPMTVSLVHLAAIGLTMWLILSREWVREARDLDAWTMWKVPLGRWLAACTPGPPPGGAWVPECSTRRAGGHAMASVDLLALVVGLSLVTLVFVSLIAVAFNLMPSTGKRHRVASSGGLAAGWAGFALLNSVYGLLVLGLDWAPLFLQSKFQALSQLRNVPAHECSAVDPLQGMSACVRSVYPYEPGPVSPWFHFTFVPSLLFVVILLALLLAAFGRPAERVKGIGLRGHLKRRAHATIVRLGDGAPLVTLVIVLIASGATAFAWLRIVDARSTGWDGVAAVVATAGALVVTLHIGTLGRLPRIKALGYVGDLVGFWPVRHHPLGGSSYRKSVTTDLDHYLQREIDAGHPVVLVGHSQGSVLAAWVTHEMSDRAKHGLVTCGSPLVGLYGAFFPEHFSAQWFNDTASRARGWVNVWRDTDPISAPIPALEPDGNVQLADTKKPVNSHGNYWEDEGQADAVELLMAIDQNK